jgi:chromosomal replication initiation ATPase DnaA
VGHEKLIKGVKRHHLSQIADQGLILFINGSYGSGKTHLAHVWAAMTGGEILTASDLRPEDIPALAARRATVLEDADDGVDEDAMFHLHNLKAAEGNALLITATLPPSRWPLTLPDLKSRMEATPLAKLAAPDDDLLRAVLLKQFADRQLDVAPRVIDYLLPRIERSFDAAGRIVRDLDALALSEKSKVSLRLAARLLDDFDDQDD